MENIIKRRIEETEKFIKTETNTEREKNLLRAEIAFLEHLLNYAHSSTLLNDHFVKGRKVWYDTSKLAVITEVINTELVNIKWQDQEFTIRKEFLSLAPEGI